MIKSACSISLVTCGGGGERSGSSRGTVSSWEGRSSWGLKKSLPLCCGDEGFQVTTDIQKIRLQMYELDFAVSFPKIKFKMNLNQRNSQFLKKSAEPGLTKPGG